MRDRRITIEHARRILGSFEDASEEIAHVTRAARSTAPAVAAPGALEGAFIPRPPSRGAGAETVGFGSPLDVAFAADREQKIVDGLEAMKKIDGGRESDITPGEQIGLEAIVLLTGRPAILIQNDDFLEPPKKWALLKDRRADVTNVIKRVGRVNVTGHPEYEWIGTGFLVGPDRLLTNRHVAVEFARSQAGGWTFKPGMTAGLDFCAELGADKPLEFAINGVVGIHDDHDLAVLSVNKTSGIETLPDPLPVASQAPTSIAQRQIYVIGYPAWDGRRNDPEPMKRIFAEIFNVKRLQPGEMTGESADVLELFHDCSTLGGNSGSPVVDLETHLVLGLHFGGRYLENNHAVPLWKLQKDPLVKKANLNFV